jgi:uncharacterized protein YndB with AHSA1/START domain
MQHTGNEATVRRAVRVPTDIDRAFAVFAGEIGRWWPAENTFANVAMGQPDAFATVVVEPRAGGRWFERTRDGQEMAWGRVTAYEPPRRLVLTWQITPQGRPEPDPAKASVVDVRFVPEGSSTTRVELEHRAFDWHGAEGAAVWREAMASAEGWTKFLARYESATR